jgi:hypothetical protein
MSMDEKTWERHPRSWRFLKTLAGNESPFMLIFIIMYRCYCCLCDL